MSIFAIVNIAWTARFPFVRSESEISASNCFGLRRRDAGQNLVPEPPARMTA